MKKPQLEHRHAPAPYASYVTGFLLSVVATVVAYVFVTQQLLPKEALTYTVMGIAVVQLVIQMVFFLHIGRGSRWKLLTFVFTVVIVLIVAIGTIWVMNHLNYNMMDMSPDEMNRYMDQHEGI